MRKFVSWFFKNIGISEKFRWANPGLGHILCKCSFGLFLRFNDLILKAANGTQREMQFLTGSVSWKKQPKEGIIR